MALDKCPVNRHIASRAMLDVFPIQKLSNNFDQLLQYIAELEDWCLEADELLKAQYASNLKLQKRVEGLEMDNAYLNRVAGDEYYE